MMLGSLGFALELDDGSNALDARAWKAIALNLLARTGDGLVVCDPDLAILYSSPHAAHLLERFEASPRSGRDGAGPARPLPQPIGSVVTQLLTDGETARTARAQPVVSGSPIELEAWTLRAAGRSHVIVLVREELPRDDDLYAQLKDRFGVTMRGFQLARLVRKGLTNRQIAESLHLTESTVKGYLHQLYRACGVSSRTGLIALLDRLSGRRPEAG